MNQLPWALLAGIGAQGILAVLSGACASRTSRTQSMDTVIVTSDMDGSETGDMIAVHHRPDERLVAKLPPEAKRVKVQGKECWTWRGRYYRRHRDGYERFHPFQ
jgi:hypothetical protein